MSPKITRRNFLVTGSLFVSGIALMFGTDVLGQGPVEEKKGRFPVNMSEKEWEEKLAPETYNVLRNHGTERAFTSPLNDEKRKGVFKCAGCGNELFSSDTKFDSGTGWPSFWEPIDVGAVGTSTDYKLVAPRTEVHCADCGGHLGHVFDDGPAPTGKRYCMNGVAMTFMPGG